MDSNTQSKPIAKPSPAEMQRIKAAFSTLQQGDKIVGEAVSLLVIRVIEGKGAVLGNVCGCGNHLVEVFDTTFAWSDEKETLVTARGDTPNGWSHDLQVHRGDGIKLASEYAHVPIAADYDDDFSDRIVDDILEPGKQKIVNGAEMLYFGSDLVSMRNVLALLGINATTEQAALLNAIVSGARELENALRHSPLDDLLGSILSGLASGSVQHTRTTKH